VTWVTHVEHCLRSVPTLALEGGDRGWIVTIRARSETVLEEIVRAGSRGGFLSELPQDVADRLVAGAIRITVPAGALIYRDGESPRVIVVMSGLLRVFLRSADGRQVTVRYARDGDVAGLLQVLGGPGPTSIQAMTSASVAALQIDTLRSLLASDPRVARVCAEELTRQLYKALEDLSEQAFLPLRERLVLLLLDLASPGDERQLVVRASQQELADAIGSVREVVTRTLHRLQGEGLIETTREGIVILDPMRLSEEVGAREQNHRRTAAADRSVR
jgi:CRP/FNR family transcriptional regulator, cyclic AMP receptor protein